MTAPIDNKPLRNCRCVPDCVCIPDRESAKAHDVPAAQEKLREWQPIETAPKDGTAILVYTGSGWYVTAWLQGDDTDAGIDWWYVDDNKHGPYPLRGNSPTHWMPLPNPPATIEQLIKGE